PQELQRGTERLSPGLLAGVSLFLMSWCLEARSLVAAVRRPLPALWALVISFGALPGPAWLAGHLLPQDDLRVGLLLIASVPCTLASAVLWTRRAGGSEATALVVTLLSACTAWLATTAWLALGTGMGIALDPSMMTDLVLVLIVPVGLGQLC